MALNGLLFADVPLSNYSLTHNQVLPRQFSVHALSDTDG